MVLPPRGPDRPARRPAGGARAFPRGVGPARVDARRGRVRQHGGSAQGVGATHDQRERGSECVQRRREADVPPEVRPPRPCAADDVRAGGRCRGGRRGRPAASSAPERAVGRLRGRSTDVPRLDLGVGAGAGPDGHGGPGGPRSSRAARSSRRLRPARGRAVQLQPYAAPQAAEGSGTRSAPSCRGHRGRRRDGRGGGRALRAGGPGDAGGRRPHGQKARQQVRFAGRRRAALVPARRVHRRRRHRRRGPADLEDVVRGVVVVRGGDPMVAPRAAPAAPAPAGGGPAEPRRGRQPLPPFSRGPEITEIR